MRLRVTAWEERSGVFIIRPEGELVINNHENFEREVKATLSKDPAILIFDLEDVDYISSMGLRTLLVAQKKMTTLRGRLFLVNLQPQVKKILEIVRVFQEEQIFANSDDMTHFLKHLE